MSSPSYSSARLRPRRAGLRFTRCPHLTNGLIQHRSCSGSDTTFLFLPRLDARTTPDLARRRLRANPGVDAHARQFEYRADVPDRTSESSELLSFIETNGTD